MPPKSSMKQAQIQAFSVKEEGDHETRWRPDSCWSWLVCAASGILLVIVSGIRYSFGLLLPPLIDNFETTRQAAAWIGALYLASAYLLSPLGSYIMDRTSYRFTAVLGSLAGIIGFSLASLSSKLWMMYLAYGLLSGFSFGMLYNSSTLVVVQYFVRRRSLAVGIVTSATAVGILAITQITQVLVREFGWRGALRGFAVLYFVCGLCSTVFVPLDRLKEEGSDNNASSAKLKQKETRNSPLWNRPFIILTASLTVLAFGYFVPTMHIIKHCEQELGIPGKKSAMLFTYLAIASFFSRHFFCKLGDFKFFNRFYLYQGGMTISGLVIVCLPLARSFGSLVTLFVLYGLMNGAMMGQFSLLVLECVGTHKVNQAWGCLMVVMGVSVGTGPPMAGLMADKFGSYAASFYTSGALVIAGASIISLMTSVKQHPEDSVKTQSCDEELLVTERVTVL